MQIIKSLIISTFLLFSTFTVQADDSQSIVSNINDKQISLFTPGTNCGFSKSNAASDAAIDLNAITVGPYVCDEDVLWNIYTSIQGNDSITDNLIGLHNVEKHLGFNLVKKGSIMLTAAYETVSKVYMAFFAITSLISVFMMLMYVKDREGVVAQHIHKPIIVLAGLIIIYILKTFITFFALWGIAFANLIGFSSLMTNLQAMDNESTGISTTDITNITTNTTHIMGMAFEKERGCQVILANSYGKISTIGQSFWGLTSAYTPATLATDVAKYCDFKVETKTSWQVGMDMTVDASDVFNPNIAVTSYDIVKVTPLTVKNRELFAYKTVLGTVGVGANGLDFEDVTSESMNDGNLVNQLNNVQSKAQSALGARIISDVDAAYAMIYKKMEGGGQVDSTNLLSDSDFKSYNQSIQNQIQATSKSIADSEINIDKLKLQSSSSAPLVKGYAYANIKAVLLGHDKKGAAILSLIEKFRSVLTVAKMNEMCTKTWEEHAAQRKFVSTYNALENTSIFDQARTGKSKDEMMMNGSDCLYVDAANKKIGFYGSSNPEDIIKFKREQLAMKLALEMTWQNYHVGLKSALASENNLYNALIAEMLETSKLGFVGTLAIAQKQITMFKTAEAKKSEILNSALQYSYLGASGEVSNYVNLDLTNEALSTDARKVLRKRSFDDYPAIDLNNLKVTGIMNISPERLDDQNFLASFQLMKWILSMVALDPVSVKSYIGSDPDYSVQDGANLCIKNMAVCKARTRPPLSQAVNQMGLDWINWAESMLLAKAVSSSAVLLIDSLPDLVDKVSTGFVGTGSGSSKWSGFKVIATLVGKPLVVAVKTLDAVLSVFMPLVTIMLIAGAFVAYIIPILTTFIIFNAILYVIWFTIQLQVLTIPIRLIKCVMLNLQEAIREIKGMIFDVFSVICHLPFLAFFMFLAIFINDNIDISTPAIYLLSQSDGTVIGGIMSLVSVFWFMVFIILTNINNIATNTNKASTSAFGFKDEVKDGLIDKMVQSLQNPMFIQAGTVVLERADTAKNNVIESHKRNKANEARRAFKNLGSQGTSAE